MGRLLMNKFIKFLLIIVGGLVIIGIIAVVVFVVTTKVTPEPANLSPEATQGKSLFLTTCNHCHLEGGRESLLGFRALSASRLDEAAMIRIIRQGKGSMPSNQKLSDSEVNLLVTYLKAIRVAA